MAKVTFITFYNNFCVGINILSSLLIEEGHDVSVIFFKIPQKKKVDWFTEKPTAFLEAVDCNGDIYSGDAVVNRWSDKEVQLLCDLIEEQNPDIIGFNSRTQDNELASEVFPKIRERTKAVTIAGGFGPSLNPEIYAKLVDYVYIGEAEATICDLISKISKGESVENFSNLYFIKDGKTIQNPLSPPDESKYVRQHITEDTFYVERNRIYKYNERQEIISTNAYSIFLGKGCISTCSYCAIGNWRAIYKNEGYRIKPRRNRRFEHVIKELTEIKDKGISFIHFRDEFMTAEASQMKKFFEIYEQEINLPFWANIVPKQMINNPDLLKQLVDAGFVDTEIGCQSGSDEINRTIFTRNIPHKDTLRYAQMLSDYEVNIQYDFIIFNPAEKQKHIDETIELIQKLPKKRAKLLLPRLYYYPLVPLNEIFIKLNLKDVPIDIEHYYCLALKYLICFVMPKPEFDEFLVKEGAKLSAPELKAFYQKYLKDHNISFVTGTHDFPESITNPRYKRILQRHNHKDIIVWGDEDYYGRMTSVFADADEVSHVDDLLVKDGSISEEIMGKVANNRPIFVCSSRKGEIKQKIKTLFPEYSGRIYV